MKRLLWLFLFFFLNYSSFTQKAISFRDSNGLNGLKNAAGQVIIPGTYSFAINFTNGFAVVSLHKKYGVINEAGSLVIPLMYDLIYPSKSAWFKAKNNNAKPFFIHPNGKVFTPSFDYDDLEDFANGKIIFTKNKKMGVADSSGTIIAPPNYDYIKKFSEGLAAFAKEGRAYSLGYMDSKWGFMNEKGEEIIRHQFSNIAAEGFNNGLCAVSFDSADKSGTGKDKWGYINTKGELVIPIIYNYAAPFSEGIALVNQGNVYGSGGNWGFIKKDGSLLFPAIKCVKIIGNGRSLKESGFVIVRTSMNDADPNSEYKINNKGERIK